MEKLIELLNQFEEEKKSDNRWGLTYIDNELMGLSNIREARLAVISKEYGFIKWLVENDKIDLDKLLNNQKEYFILQVGNDNYNSENYFVDGLLMLLSISDTPIEDLLLYLK